MKLLLTNLFLLFSITLNGQTELGIGLVSINITDTAVLSFYDTATTVKESKTIEFFNDKLTNGLNIRNLEKQKEWLKPEVLWIDYSYLFFRCISHKNGWYEVIVNNDNGKTYWLMESERTKFSDWETFLTGMFGVSRLSNSKQAIKEKPTESSKEIKYKWEDCFQVKSMNGDWIEIFTAGYCYLSSKATIKSGWIKWRQGNRLLIEYFITS